jgi:type 1 fimbria pilin
MKNRILSACGALVFVFACAFAFSSTAADRNVTVPGNETMSTDYINAGQTVDVGSDVQGDVILAGSAVSYSGDASGDIILAGGNVRVKGNSGGNVRLAGGNITLDGNVERNVTIVGGSVIIEETSVIRGNLYVAGGNVELRGTVEGNATIYSSQVQFSGKVAGNADFRSSEVVVRPDASIGGNLTYASNAEVNVNQNIVKGTVTKVPMQNYQTKEQVAKAEREAGIGVAIWSFLSLLIVGLVLFKLFGRQLRELAAPVTREEVWNRIAIGLLSFLLNLLIIFVTFITIIGLPLALMILFLYVIMLIVAAVLSPVLLGKWLNGRLKLFADEDRHQVLAFILGYVAMQIIGFVPVFGPLFLFVLFLFSFGRVTQYLTGAWKRNQ